MNTNIKCKEDILVFLKEHKDEKYRGFSAKLLPTVDKNLIIGVRVPIIRKLAKDLKNTLVADDYLNSLPHKYLEENHLHGFLIETINDFDTALSFLIDFLPHIDNWATCDTIRPKIFIKHTEALYPYIKKWLDSSHTYTVRYAIGLLNSFYLDDNFDTEHLKLVMSIESEEYYINMMIAWYFATALSKQYKKTIPFIESKILPKWTHNKAIQKAIESYRISDETKIYLKTLKI